MKKLFLFFIAIIIVDNAKAQTLSGAAPIIYNSSTGVISSQPASATQDGHITSGSQTIGGIKTFTADNIFLSTNFKVGIGGGGQLTNAAIGYGALSGNSTGINNTAIGYNSLVTNTSGSNNIAIGYATLAAAAGNTNENIALGYATGIQLTGSYNTYVGSGQVGYSATSGQYNSAFGYGSANQLTTGSFNAFFGRAAGGGILTGSYNTFIGQNTSIGDVSNHIILADGQGNNRMVIDNNGLVGIGTSNPAYTLDVNGTFRAASINSIYLGYGSTGVSNSLAIGTNVLSNVSGTGVANVAVGSNVLNANTTGFDNVAIGSGTMASNLTGYGNVAVGADALGLSPSGSENVALGLAALLHNTSGWRTVAIGSGSLAAQTTGSLNTAIGTYSGGSLTEGFGNTFVGGYTTVHVTGSGNTIIGADASYSDFGLTTGSGNTIIGANISGLSPTLSNHIILGDGSGNQRLIIDENGNVGVGTASPDSKLHLHEDGSSGATALKLTNRNSTQTYGIAVDATAVDDAKFMIYNFNNTTPNFVIDNGGNIGIGTADPQGYKLAVNGGMIATSVKVKAYANWPDYVFGKGHELMPLADLKAYVDKNQHLPEIPSAAEVEKNGQDLGEINKILVKKVEELTLYLIEKDKEDKARQKEVDELKMQVALLLNASQKDKQ